MVKNNKNNEVYEINDERKAFTEKLKSVFDSGPEAIMNYLPKLVALKIITMFLGKDFEKEVNYYGKLLYNFSIDHPIETSALIKALVDLTHEKKQSGLETIINAGATALVPMHLLDYRSTLQTRELKNILKKGFRRSRYEGFLKIVPGMVLTKDGETFYEIESGFGDPPSRIKTFEICGQENNLKKYSRDILKMDKKEMSKFILENELIEVTDILRPDLKKYY